MATAPAVTLRSRAPVAGTVGDRSAVVTTSDAALTLISVEAGIESVLVQPTSAAGCYVQLEGAAQAGTVDAAAVEVAVGGSLLITPRDCGYGEGQAWAFGVARLAAGAVIRLNGSKR